MKIVIRLVKVRERPREADRLAEMVSRERNFITPLGIFALDLSDPAGGGGPGPAARARVVVAAARGDALPWEDTLQPGDVIYTLNGQSIMGIDQLRTALGGLGGKRSAVLQVEREGVLRYFAVPLE